MTMPPNDTKQRKIPRFALILAAACAGAVVGFAGIYGIGAFKRNAGTDPSCQPAVDLARKIAPLARGEVAAVAVDNVPRRVPALSFQNAERDTKQLTDWHGRYVLLNLWATWCVPCRKEMPALDALQAKLGGPDFEVVAVNIDTRDPDKPHAWLKEVGVSKLAYYADPSAKVFQELKSAGRVIGLPTSFLIDKQGCEVASLAGPAEWASDDAIRLISALIGTSVAAR